jgi:hypothetical protein
MKKHFLTMMAALVSVCLFLTLALPQFRSTGLSLASGDSQPPPRASYISLYLEKRQWLADARTILAAIRYLYASRATNTIIPMHIVRAPHWLFPPPGFSTNLLESQSLRPCSFGAVNRTASATHGRDGSPSRPR